MRRDADADDGGSRRADLVGGRFGAQLREVSSLS